MGGNDANGGRMSTWEPDPNAPDRYMAIAHEGDPDEAFTLLVEFDRFIRDGSMQAVVRNGSGTIAIGTGDYRFLGSEERHPCRIVWSGNLPGGLDLDEAIELIRGRLRAGSRQDSDADGLGLPVKPPERPFFALHYKHDEEPVSMVVKNEGTLQNGWIQGKIVHLDETIYTDGEKVYFGPGLEGGFEEAPATVVWRGDLPPEVLDDLDEATDWVAAQIAPGGSWTP